jgi:hypothetical protein
MVKAPIVVFLAFVLLAPLKGFSAGEKQQKIENYPQQKGDKLQEYKNDIPQHGNYYEWDGRKWQRYEGNIPQTGNYLKKIKGVNREKDKKSK